MTLIKLDQISCSRIDQILPLAGSLFLWLQQAEFLKDNESQGGFLCIADESTGIPRMILGIGEVPPEKWEKYLQLCQEKASRLAQHPTHVCSAESRYDRRGKYPGAIRTNAEIISFSGLPWEYDESLCLLIAIKIKSLSITQATDIAKLSGNNWFAAVLKASHLSG